MADPTIQEVKDGFSRTLNRFKNRLDQKQLDRFKITTLEDVKIEIKRIQDDQGSQKGMMNLKRIQAFLEGMEQFGKVIEVFVNSSNFVAFVWGPVKFLLQIARTWADAFDVLLEAYKEIGEQIPLLIQYKALFEGSPQMGKILEMIYSDILEFHERAIPYFTDKVWKTVFRSVWKDFESRFGGVLAELKRHKELIYSQATLLHFQNYQVDQAVMAEAIRKNESYQNRILGEMHRYETERFRVSRMLQESEDSERQRKYSATIKWLGGSDAICEYESVKEKRLDSAATGDWILRHEKVRNWKDPQVPTNPVLWMTGIPGAGKSVLSTVVVENCLKDSAAQTSCFYCVQHDPTKNTFVAILRGLLSQLLSQCPELVPYFFDKHNSSAESTLTTAHLAKQLFEVCCEKINKLYIIIDGLDECELAERRLTLSYFAAQSNGPSSSHSNGVVSRFEAKDPGKIRLMVVSQTLSDISRSFTTADNLTLTPCNTKPDIESFVMQAMNAIKAKFELTDSDVRGIIHLTCERADGMFLFARLVMSNLYAQPTRDRFWKEVEKSRFPKELRDAYERIMSRIKETSREDEWEIAVHLLGLMVCAKRPLGWHEIQAAMSIDTVAQKMDFDEKKLRVHIRDLCGSLVHEKRGGNIALVHSTAKHYITHTDPPYVREVLVECRLTALCMQYLTFDCFEDNVEKTVLQSHALKGDFAFQDYAIANWYKHVRAMVIVEEGPVFGEPETDRAIEDLKIGLGEFFDFYEGDLGQTKIIATSHEACKSFDGLQPFEHLTILKALWSHSEQHLGKSFDERSEVSIIQLSRTLNRNRELLETFISSTEISYQQLSKLTEFYSNKHFKCPKVGCEYFHSGFENGKERDLHVDRHDLPFRCDIPGCSRAEMGMKTSKELEMHTKRYHLSADTLSFTKISAEPSKTPFACTMCPKRFTRNFHLKSHIRNHNQEKPFECSECGRAFTRANDCNRHKQIHKRH